MKDYVCQIRAIQHIELRALARGYVEDVHVDEGQAIKAGQLMFQVMPRLYQAKLGKAQAEAQFAEVEYHNTERLAKTNIVAVNNAKPTQAVELGAMDVITMGHTQLVFVPFCGAEFDWGELTEMKS